MPMIQLVRLKFKKTLTTQKAKQMFESLMTLKVCLEIEKKLPIPNVK